MSANQLTLWYLVASVLFILALKGLSSPTTARRGNLFGMIGMGIAVLVTLAVVARGNVTGILVAMLVGGAIGAGRDNAAALAVEGGAGNRAPVFERRREPFAGNEIPNLRGLIGGGREEPATVRAELHVLDLLFVGEGVN